MKSRPPDVATTRSHEFVMRWRWPGPGTREKEPVLGSSLAFRGERVRPGRLEGGRMTYQTSDGTQFLVIGVTGLGSDRRLIAFALPEG